MGHLAVAAVPGRQLLLIHGRRPALVDSGIVGHADDAAEWARAQAAAIALVVNTHWHFDHIGANALLQSAGATIAASGPDTEALQRRDPGCCFVENLDQPVPSSPSTKHSTTTDPAARRHQQADYPYPGPPPTRTRRPLRHPHPTSRLMLLTPNTRTTTVQGAEKLVSDAVTLLGSGAGCRFLVRGAVADARRRWLEPMGAAVAGLSVGQACWMSRAVILRML